MALPINCSPGGHVVRCCGAPVTSPIHLTFAPGEAAAFLDQLWTQLPADPAGALVGAVHHIGGRGQIVVRVNGRRARELVVLPGQILVVTDSADADSWSVIEGPAPVRLNLPS